MSAFAYTPRFDGIHTTAALPGRCPVTGQFVSGEEADDVVTPTAWQPLEEIEVIHEEELDDEWADLHPDVWIGWTGCDEGSIAPPKQPIRDKYHVLAQRCFAEHLNYADGGTTVYRYFSGLCEDLGLETWRFDFDDVDDQSTLIEIWVQRRYHIVCKTADGIDVDNPSDVEAEYEYLPLFEPISTGQQFRLGNYFADIDARQPHRKGRKHICNQRSIRVRRKRRDTHRQMDYIWLAEMVEPTHSPNEASFGEIMNDAELHLHEINDELWQEYEYELLLTKQHWEWHHSGPMTEVLQNSHGFSDRDPVEEEIERILAAEENSHWEWNWDPFQFDDFWDADQDEYDDYYDLEAEERAAEDQWYDNLVISQEDLEIMEDEERRVEQEEDEFWKDFDHFPAGNGIGRKTQMSLRMF